MLSDRQHLEQCIVGACLIESSAFLKVADFLEPRNFSNPVYGEIYRAMCRLFPESPIDLITVNRATNNMFVNQVGEAASVVSSSVNLRTHAAILIEYSIRDTAIATLSKHIDESFNQNVINQVAIKEAIDEFLDHSIDTFELIDKAKEFFEERVANEELAGAFQSMQRMVDERVSRMKQQARADALLQYFMQIGNVPDDPKARLAATHLCNVLLGIIASGKVSDEQAKKIFDV